MHEVRLQYVLLCQILQKNERREGWVVLNSTTRHAWEGTLVAIEIERAARQKIR